MIRGMIFVIPAKAETHFIVTRGWMPDRVGHDDFFLCELCVSVVNSYT